MSVTTISLGTAGTQSGDKVRDAFNIVNQNFQNFQLNDLKGFYKYYGSAIAVKNTSWATTSELFSSIPAGTYLMFLGVRLYTLVAGYNAIDVFPCDENEATFNTRIIGVNTDTYGRNGLGVCQITKASSFGVKLKYRLLTYDGSEGGVMDMITILLLKIA